MLFDTRYFWAVFTTKDRPIWSKTALKHAQNEQFPQENSDSMKARLYKEGVGVPRPNPRKSRSQQQNLPFPPLIPCFQREP